MMRTALTIWQTDPITVQRGDVWALGKHRLYCGDATNPQDVARLFDGERFSLCFTSPPYSDQREYKLGAFNWHSLMCGAFDQMIANGTPDCHVLIDLGLSHKKRQVDMYWLEWLMYCSQVGWPVFGWYVWDKGTGFPGEWHGRLAPCHEFIFHFNQQGISANKWVEPIGKRRVLQKIRQKDGSMKLSNSPDKRYQERKIPDSIIRINRASDNGSQIPRKHPAIFPVALPEFIYKTWSQPGDIVYEPFCGSGTSLIAGENLNRRVYACEISEEYCELAIQRWQEHTGQQAQRVEVTTP